MFDEITWQRCKGYVWKLMNLRSKMFIDFIEFIFMVITLLTPLLSCDYTQKYI